MESWKSLKLSFNLATEKTNLDAFVLAQTRRTQTILLGCYSILGSCAAQERFLWPFHKANNSARDKAVFPQGLQELCPVPAILKLHCSHRKINKAIQAMSPDGKKHQGALNHCKEQMSLHSVICCQEVSRG